MRLLLASLIVLALVGNSKATPPDSKKDTAARAKAVLILSGGPTAEDARVAKKAEYVLSTSGLQVAPAPREKTAPVAPAELPISNPAAPCRDGTCHPTIPGFVRGNDGVYRQVGVAATRERR